MSSIILLLRARAASQVHNDNLIIGKMLPDCL